LRSTRTSDGGRMQEVEQRTVAMAKLLIIGEIGSLPFGRSQSNLSFQVVVPAYEKCSRRRRGVRCHDARPFSAPCHDGADRGGDS
jgi:hypothetical protein